MRGLSVGRPIPDRQLAGYLWRCAAIQNVTDFAGQEREAGTSQLTRVMFFARERRVRGFAIAAPAAPRLWEAPPPPCG